MFILIVGTNLVIDEKVTNRIIVPIITNIRLREIMYVGSTIKGIEFNVWIQQWFYNA